MAGQCLGCLTQFAIDVRLRLPATCARTAGPTCSPGRTSRVRTRRPGHRSTRCGPGGRNHDVAFHRGAYPAGADPTRYTMRFDVASPTGTLQHSESNGVVRMGVNGGLAVPVRGVAGWECSGGAERGRWGRAGTANRCLEGCLNVAGACSAAAARAVRDRGGRRWRVPGGHGGRGGRGVAVNGSCSGRRSARRVASTRPERAGDVDVG